MIHEAIDKKRGTQPQRFNSKLLLILLLTVGKIWLFIQLGSFGVWWASFIFLAAMPFYMGAWTFYKRENGRLTLPLGILLSFGLIISTVATLFWLSLDWQVWWPMMLIVPGLAMWVNGQMRPAVDKYAARHSLGLAASWAGFTTFLLGSTFLAHNCGWINLTQFFPRVGWWGFFIMLPGLGLLYSTGRVKQYYDAGLLLFWDAVTAVLLTQGGIELLNMTIWSVNRVLGTTFIVSGLLLIIYRLHADHAKDGIFLPTDANSEKDAISADVKQQTKESVL